MPLIIPRLNTSVETPLPSYNPNEAALKALLLGAQNGADLQQKKIMAGIGQENAGQNLQKGLETLLANPKISGVSLDESGRVGLQRQDNSLKEQARQEANDIKRERVGLTATKNISNEYKNLVGQSPGRVLAAQAVLKALQDDDITSAGRIKANLPKLEGENYKPTDTERELIIQTTGEGVANKLKNFLGMSTTPLSAAQKKALSDYTMRRLTEEQSLVDRSRKEVMSRYKPAIHSLEPSQMAEIEGSLGLGAGDLIKHLQSSPAPIAPSMVQNLKSGLPGVSKPAGLSPAEQSELEILRKRFGK